MNDGPADNANVQTRGKRRSLAIIIGSLCVAVVAVGSWFYFSRSSKSIVWDLRTSHVTSNVDWPASTEDGKDSFQIKGPKEVTILLEDDVTIVAQTETITVARAGDNISQIMLLSGPLDYSDACDRVKAFALDHKANEGVLAAIEDWRNSNVFDRGMGQVHADWKTGNVTLNVSVVRSFDRLHPARAIFSIWF